MDAPYHTRWLRGAGLLAAVGGVLVLALSPPVLPPGWRSVVQSGFAPVCHQLPLRSPFVGGVQLAVCDRCFGIYGGLVVGVATIGWGRRAWARVRGGAHYVLLGSLVPLGMDWVGPVLGLWANGPLSRAVTGVLFGVVAGSFAAYRLLQAGGAAPASAASGA